MRQEALVIDNMADQRSKDQPMAEHETPNSVLGAFVRRLLERP